MTDKLTEKSGYTQRADGTYVPKNEMKTAILKASLGDPEVIICDGKRYYPALEGSDAEIVSLFVASLIEDEEYAAEKMGQAQPVYYSIRDKRRVVSADGYSDLSVFVFDGGPDGEFYLRDALAVYAGLDEAGLGVDWYGEDEVEAHIEKIKRLDDVFDANGEIRDDVPLHAIRSILEDLNIGEEIFVSEEWYIRPNTMFLTHVDAEQHLKENSHHYTEHAHVYCMTAWRSPAYEKFINALKSMYAESC